MKMAYPPDFPSPYTDFSAFLRRHFSGKVQKLSLDAGFTCPNRDGTKGRGGCTYCNNRTFNPGYCRTDGDIIRQLERGKQFFARKYPEMKYLAYFQAYTNTYGSPDTLRRLYEAALGVADVVGVVIGTRPDCVPDTLLDYLARLRERTFVLVEYGIESTLDRTLRRINRGHTFADTADAIRRTHRRGIPCGGHVILGLPGETREDIWRQAATLSALPLDTLKLHQLQVIRGTRMEREYRERPADFHLFAPDDYLDTVVGYVERLRPGLALERFLSQSPRELLVAPDWGLKNHEFTERLRKKMQETGTYQGRKYMEI